MKQEDFEKYYTKFYGDVTPSSIDDLTRMLKIVIGKYDKQKSNPMETAVKMMMLTNNFVESHIGKKYDLDQVDLVYMMLKKKARMGLMIYNADDIFYPQFDNKFKSWIEDLAFSDEFIEEAENKLKVFPFGSPEKLRRWRTIANQKHTKKTKVEDLTEVDNDDNVVEQQVEAEVAAQ